MFNPPIVETKEAPSISPNLTSLKQKGPSLLGRSFCLLKGATCLIGSAAFGSLALAAMVAYVALQILSTLAFITIIGVPIGVALWGVAALTKAAASRVGSLAFHLLKQSGSQTLDVLHN